MSRWLGVDFGSKYVGVAVGDEAIAMPLKVLDARPDEKLLSSLKKLAASEDVAGIVVGLPVNMDGSEGKAAKLCREFGARLAAHSQLPVEYADERLSSWEAEGMLIEGGLKPSERKQRVHAVAAKLILEAFFSARKAANEAGSGPSGEQAKE
ncbi:MAG: Holliday junction resolvase RuvX [Planctomycetota bacterium]|nr:Holliday junction resolvase RuvX [Planctomycetota bacterium]